MTNVDVARAWRDPKYRRSLGLAAADLPQNPAGMIELTDEELIVAGGALSTGPIKTTAVNCTLFTFLAWAACGCGPVTTAINCTLYSFRKSFACGCP